jgi:hypothetical protein
MQDEEWGMMNSESLNPKPPKLGKIAIRIPKWDTNTECSELAFVPAND